MTYAAEVGLVATMYMPNFISNGRGIQKLMGGGRSQRHGMEIA
jgi:hypothetical protein